MGSPAHAPYKGLERYDIGDGDLFYGRADECEIVEANLKASPITVVYGASGVRKSSLLRAGVAGSLAAEQRREVRSGRSTYYALAIFDGWRDDPIAGLRDAISGTVRAVTAKPAVPSLPQGPLEDVINAAMAYLGECRLLVILDQFEEYFVYRTADAGPDTFATQFPKVVGNPGLRVNFLLSIREDALAQLDDFELHIPQLLRNRLRIRALSEHEARDAIRGPLSRFGADIEPALVEEVIQVARGRTAAATLEPPAAAGGEVATPYLQLLMEALWTEEQRRRSRLLRLETYNQLGGAEKIVQTHVDSAIGQLTGSEQTIAARILHYLVTPAGTKMAQTVPDLGYLAQCDSDQVASLLDTLARKESRIVRAVTDGRPGAPQRYELFHDVLARPILAWRTSYVEAEEDARFRRRRTQVLIGAVAALVIGLAIVGGVLYAIKNREVADQAQRNANSSNLAIAALATAAGNPARAVKTALAALDAAKTPTAEEALREVAPEYMRLRTVIGAKPQTHWAVMVGNSDVVAYAGSTVDFWNSVTGRLTRSFHALQTAAVNPSTGTLVTVDRRGDLTVHDLLTGTSSPARPGEGATHATISGDGRVVFTWGANGVVRDQTGAPTASVPATGGVGAAGLSGKGQTLTLVSSGGDVKVLERSSRGAYSLDKLITAGGPWLGATPSPDGGDILLRSSSTVSLYRLRGGQTIPLARADSGRIDSAAFDATGKSVVTAAENGDTRAYDSATGALTATYTGGSGSVKDAVFSHDGVLVAAAGNDGTVRIWNHRTSAPYLALTAGPVPMRRLAFSADNSELLATTLGSYDVWSVNPRVKVTTEQQLADVAIARKPSSNRSLLARVREGVESWFG